MILALLASVALRAAAVLVLGLIGYAGLMRASAAARRSLLVATLLASIAVPVVAVLAPSWDVVPRAALEGLRPASLGEPIVRSHPLADTVIPAASDLDQSVPAAPAAGFDRASALLCLWLLGVLAVGVRAIRSQLRARRLVRASECARAAVWSRAASAVSGDAGVRVDVRISDGVDSPAVTGIFRSTILLPRAAERWSRARARVVLVHEVAHVLCLDPLAQVIADAACAFHWWNPMVWLAASRLRIERELAADDAVLASGVRASTYAEELLAVAGAATVGALAMAERTILGSRIVFILAARRSRKPLQACGRALLVASGLAIGATAACVSAAAPVAPTVTAASVDGPDAPSSTPVSAQVAADEVLASVAGEWSAESAVVLVLDVGTGEILADAGRLDGHPFDVARARPLVPGSTLKPITVAAALEMHAITPNEQLECGPSPRAYGSEQIHDTEPHGMLDVGHVLAVSSNIGVSRIFDALGGERLSTWLARFHLADAPKLEGAVTGGFPAALATGTFEGAGLAMGEGSTATPLQMAAAYAALANDGVYHAPTMSHVASPGERIVSSSTATEVMKMLDLVVTDPTGTGTLARVDGTHVAGKTGTAEVVRPDGARHLYASFIGVADLPGRRVVALVGVETAREGAWGGKVAAPAFATLVRRIR